MSERVIFENLMQNEADYVLDQLQSKGIKAIMKASKNRAVHGGLCQIIISEVDYERSRPIITKFKAFEKNRALESKNSCPVCGAFMQFERIKLPFFKSLLYLGTSTRQCKKCKAIWGA